jgi:antigen flippase
VLATSVGPKGYGLFGLYGTILSLLGLFAALGIPNALTRLGSEPWAHGDLRTWNELKSAAYVLCCLGFVAISLVFVGFRVLLGRLFLGLPIGLGTVLLLSAGLAFNMLSALQNSVLKTEGRVGALARADVGVAIAVAAVIIVLVHWQHIRGILPAIPVSALVGLGVMLWYSRFSLPFKLIRLSMWRVLPRRAGQLFRYGRYYAGSSVVNAGFRMIIPFAILHMLGTAAVGLYTTATTIAVIYLGPLVSVMGRVYFPRLAGVPREDRFRLRQVISEQQELVLLLGLPAILLVLTLAPLVIPLVYTPGFLGMLPMLQWLVSADLFRYLAWSLSFVVLARASGALYLGLELYSGVSAVVLTYVGMKFFGLPGVGLGYLVFQLLYCAVVWTVTRWRMGISTAASIVRRIVVAIVVLGLADFAADVLPEAYRIVALAILTTIVGIVHILEIRRRWREDSSFPLDVESASG